MRGVSALLGFSIWLLLLQYVAAQPSQLNSRLSATSNASDTSNDDSLLDNNSTTIWTAGVGQMDATIMINPKEPGSLNGFNLSEVSVVFQGLPPSTLSLHVYRDGLLVYEGAYSENCSDVMSDCSMFDGDEVEVTFNTIYQHDVTQLILTLNGFQNESESLNHRISIVSVKGLINTAHYIHGPLSFKSEAEHGEAITNGDLSFELGSDSSVFPSFSDRGYIDIENKEKDIRVKWVINMTKTTPIENIVIYYRSKDIQSWWFSLDTMYNGAECEIRFLIQGDQDCTGNCFERAELQTLNTTCKIIKPGQSITFIGQLSEANFYLDYFAAIPGVCTKNETFVEHCNVFNTPIEEYSEECKQQALQECIEETSAVQDCGCVNSVSNECDVLGGQCECVNSYLGMNCDQCPIYYYDDNTGCAACDCPDNYDCGCSSCDGSGQCPCDSGVTGRTCDVCLDGYYGSPPDTDCIRCNCSGGVTQEICNKTDGSCICNNTLMGSQCDQCEDGYYDYTDDGCSECVCDSPGSVSSTCNNITGQCPCKPGFSSMDCSVLLPGYYVFNDTAYSCNCSNKTDDCNQDPNVSDMPSELCECPEGYDGNSCETCDLGYYMPAADGNCIACNCSNSSTPLCNITTGECFTFPVPPPPVTPPPPPPPLNCTPNLTGEYCDQCAEGYYDSSTDVLSLNCTECPCHENTTTNASCYLDGGVSPHCHCLPGHQGPLCDSCSSGYYGIPPQFPCSDCECSGNIDVSDPDACNKTTGVCTKCLYNSTGNACQNCSDGFYGNASSQDCQPCNCVNSRTESCDNVNGNCTCLVGYTGPTCSEYAEGYWNFTEGVGGQPCDCDTTGSINSSCHIITGQCHCHDGIQGRQCDICQSMHFNFTSSGCQACGCNLVFGALNNNCDVITGQCECIENDTSTRTCEDCPPLYQFINNECQPCDDCVKSLMNFTSDINDTLVSIEETIILTELLQEADTFDVGSVTNATDQLYELSNHINQTLMKAFNKLGKLNSTKNSLNLDSIILKNQIEDIINIAEEGLPIAEIKHAEVTAIRTRLQIDFDETAEINEEIKEINNAVKGIKDDSNSTQLNISLADSDIRSFSFDIDVIFAHEVSNLTLSNLNYILEKYAKLLSEQQMLSRLSTTAGDLDSDYESLYINFTTLIQELNEIQQEIENLANITEDLKTDVDTTNTKIKIAESKIETVDQDIVGLNDTIFDLNNTIVSLRSLLESNGNGLPKLLASLMDNVTRLDEEFQSKVHEFESSLTKGNDVFQTALEVQSILNSSLSSGNRAVEAIVDYESVEILVSNASQIVESTNDTLLQVSESLYNLMKDGLKDEINEMNITLEYLFAQWADLLTDIRALNTSYSTLYKAYATNKSVIDDISSNVSLLLNETNKFIHDKNQSLPVVESQLSTSMGYISNATSTVEYMSNTTLPNLLQEAEDVSNIYDATVVAVINATNLLYDANTTAVEAIDLFQAKSNLLGDIESLSNITADKISEATSSLNTLLQNLEEAEAAAASIDIALTFTGNNLVTYPIANPSTDSLYASLYFRGDVSSGTLWSSQEGASLSVVNGNLELRDDKGTLVLSSSDLNLMLANTMWYQVYISSFNSTTYLSIARAEPGTSDESLTIFAEDTSISSSGGEFTLGTDSSETSFFTGCIDRVIVNGEFIPLLSSMNATSTCGPRPAADKPFDVESGSWCFGQSYAVFNNYANSSSLSLLSLSIRTFSENAFVFEADRLDSHIRLYILDGQVHLSAWTNFFWIVSLSSPLKVNDGSWYTIQVNISNYITLTVGNTTNTTSDDSHLPIQAPFDIYIGQNGTDSDFDLPTFAGCMRNILINSHELQLDNSDDLKRIDTTGCPAEVNAGSRFMGTGYALLPSFNSSGLHFVPSVSLSFNTDQIAAVLVHLSSESLPDELYIYLFQTYVRVDFKNYGSSVTLLSDKSGFNDDYWHTVTVTMAQDAIILDVDGDEVIQPMPDFMGQLLMDQPGIVEVGGLSSKPTDPIPVSESFRGCIKDFALDNVYQDFNEATVLEGVALYGCHGTILPLPTTSTPPITSTTSLVEPTSVTVSSTTGTVSSSIEPTPTSVTVSSTTGTVSSSIEPTPTSVTVFSTTGTVSSSIEPTPTSVTVFSTTGTISSSIEPTESTDNIPTVTPTPSIVSTSTSTSSVTVVMSSTLIDLSAGSGSGDLDSMFIIMPSDSISYMFSTSSSASPVSTSMTSYSSITLPSATSTMSTSAVPSTTPAIDSTSSMTSTLPSTFDSTSLMTSTVDSTFLTTSTVPSTIGSTSSITSTVPSTIDSTSSTVSSTIDLTTSMIDSTSSTIGSTSSMTSTLPSTIDSTPSMMSTVSLTTSTIDSTSSMTSTVSSTIADSTPSMTSTVSLTTSTIDSTSSMTSTVSSTIDSTSLMTSTVSLTTSTIDSTSSMTSTVSSTIADSTPSMTSTVSSTTPKISSTSSTTSTVTSSTTLTSSVDVSTTSSVNTLSPTSTSIPPTPSIVAVGLNGLDNSYIGFSLSAFNLVKSYVINIVFRTASSNGVILYHQHITYPDFFALEIKDGYLHYTFNLGVDSVTMSTSNFPTKYDDNIMHNVTITRQGRSGSLIVDDGTVNGASIEDHTQLNTGSSLLYMGGVPNNLSEYSLSDTIPPGLLACFNSLTINDVSVDLNLPEVGVGMTECVSNLTDNVSFNGEGHAIIEPNYAPLIDYGYEFEFRTVHCSGLLLYATSYSDKGDHTALELYNGAIRFIFDNGAGPTVVSYTPPPGMDQHLCDGEWHTLLVTKDFKTGEITVDNNITRTNTTDPNLPSYSAVNIDSPLYAGGVPADLIPRRTVLSQTGFNGCLSNMQLITNVQDNIRDVVHFAQATVSSDDEVQLYTCHV